MNALNRLLLILVALALLACAGSIILVTLAWLPLHDVAGIPWVSDRLTPFTHLSDTNEVKTLAICSGLLLVGLLLLVVEVVTLLPGEQPLTLKQDGLGRVTVDREVVRELANREAGQVPGVLRFTPQLQQNRNGLKIRGRLAVEPAANLVDVTQQVQERVKIMVERSLGQPVEDVRLDAHLAPLTSGHRVR
jgi:uncharacterized alkaline shock family protein YloU